MLEEKLADAVRYGYRTSHTEEGWIVPLADAVARLDAEAAKWKPGPKVASAWELVAHAIPYPESLLNDLLGDPPMESDDWPPVVDTSPEAWKALQGRVARVTNQLAEVIDGLSADELASPPKGKKTVVARRIMDMAAHDAYHAGQVVKLDQTYRAK